MFSFFKSLFLSKPKNNFVHNLVGVEYADAVFQNLVAEQKIPGVSATIIHDGSILLQKGYGHVDLENKISVDPRQSLFRIASISKCITGLALCRMVETGMLNWDDSFYEHVPYYPKKEYDFSIRQLAAHTAGIRGYRGKEFALNTSYTISESISVFKDDPLIYRPGKGYLYTSFDFVLLSLAMQEASGIPFEEYVKEEVLNPLGLENTFTPKEVLKSRKLSRSNFYTKKTTGFKAAIEVDNFYKLAGGGYLSTSEDIAKMGQAILERQLLKKTSYDQLFSTPNINGTSTFYGLGFQVSQDAKGQDFVGHIGNSVGAYTNFYVYPKKQLVFAILINCTDPKVQEELNAIIDAIVTADHLRV